MDEQHKSPFEFSVEELDQELIARGAEVPDEKKFDFKDREGTPGRDVVMTRVREIYKTPPPPNKALSHIDTWDLAKVLIFKTHPSSDCTRGSGSIESMDWNEITDDQTRKNADCVAAICLKDNLVAASQDSLTLKIKNYGKTFNLCDNEFFRDQPVSAGRMGMGFLVKDDVIATAGNFIDKKNITDLRFIFGYKMVDSSTPAVEFSNDNIYSGIEIIHRANIPGSNSAEWVLVKLDRKVQGREAAALSRDEIYWEQAVYTLGHPLGLPLKYASGASVCENITETYFSANLNMYSGCPGSPVFDINTNEILGMVVKEASCDFRWTGKGWLSIQNPDGPEIDCLKISTFIDILQKL